MPGSVVGVVLYRRKRPATRNFWIALGVAWTSIYVQGALGLTMFERCKPVFRHHFYGFLFAIITLSVVLQVGWFKATGGKRLFRMAPFHHHFELGGWPETTVIVRFWIIAGVATAVALGIFYADFLSVTEVR